MVIDVLTNMTQTIRQHFPNLTVFPALGNHDYWPQVIKDLAHSTGVVGDEGEISFKKKKMLMFIFNNVVFGANERAIKSDVILIF